MAPSAPLWAARARIDSAHDSILSLQDSARKLQTLLRAVPPVPPSSIEAARADVSHHRLALASTLGLKQGAPIPPLVDTDAPPDVQQQMLGDAIAAMAAAEAVHGPSAIDNDAVLSLLSIPKGKKLIARAVRMLAPWDRVTAVLAGMRHLPHFVASVESGRDVETADSTLASALAGWVKTMAAPAPLTVPGSESAQTLTAMGMCTQWISELQSRHPGPVVRALLTHPGASEVFTAILTRGEEEAALASAAASAAGTGSADADAEQAAAAAEVAAWRSVTDALGRSFVESG